ncbi:MAG: hypothetical protein J2P16_11780, partial [Mycobacterium sp.]|nr:hypothetical protein [Mycobacterium sp.]
CDPRRPHRLASTHQPTETRSNRPRRTPSVRRPPSRAGQRDHVDPRCRQSERRRA